MPTPNYPATATDSQSRELNAISNQLIAARASATALEQFPGELPTSLEQAYQVQTLSISRWPDSIAGWKVGGIPDSFREQLLADRLSGPIFNSSVIKADAGSSISMPIFNGGFAAVEAEFVLQIGKTIAPEDRPYTDEQLVDLVSAMHVGAEIASSPMADVNRIGPCCVVSDFGNNAGLVLGPSVPDWHERTPDSLHATVSIDGEQVGAATAEVMDGGVLQSLRFLIQLCARRELELAPGTLVSCGALTGIHEVTLDSAAAVDFGDFGAFDVTFESMQPRSLNGTAAES